MNETVELIYHLINTLTHSHNIINSNNGSITHPVQLVMPPMVCVNISYTASNNIIKCLHQTHHNTPNALGQLVRLS